MGRLWNILSEIVSGVEEFSSYQYLHEWWLELVWNWTAEVCFWGDATKFWAENWLGTGSLELRYHRLYNLSTQKREYVKNMGQWINGVWRWEFKWRRRLRGREEGWLEDMVTSLMAVQLTEKKSDRWSWRHDGEGNYSVNSSYLFLQAQHLEEPEPVFKLVWSVPVPSNVKAFAWRLLKDRIQTRDNLRRRHVILNPYESLCPLCGLQEESSTHLFLLCNATNQIWYECSAWLGAMTTLVPTTKEHLLQFPSIGRSKAQREGECVIWMAIIWTIWLCRNKAIFNGSAFDSTTILELAQLRAWRWLRAKVEGFSYSWFEWKQNPGVCIQSLWMERGRELEMGSRN